MRRSRCRYRTGIPSRSGPTVAPAAAAPAHRPDANIPSPPRGVRAARRATVHVCMGFRPTLAKARRIKTGGRRDVGRKSASAKAPNGRRSSQVHHGHSAQRRRLLRGRAQNVRHAAARHTRQQRHDGEGRRGYLDEYSRWPLASLASASRSRPSSSGSVAAFFFFLWSRNSVGIGDHAKALLSSRAARGSIALVGDMDVVREGSAFAKYSRQAISCQVLEHPHLVWTPTARFPDRG